jgi:uncharacterized membrane protein
MSIHQVHANTSRHRQTSTLIAIIVATTIVFFALDLLWLGVIANGFYDSALGPLKRDQINWPAAIAFYAMYIGVIVRFAVLKSRDRNDALRRGAFVGFLAYATYELTNWAVIAGWPARLVLVDITWGVFLTTAAAWTGKSLQQRRARLARQSQRLSVVEQL